MGEQTPHNPQGVQELRYALGKAYNENASDEVIADLEAKLQTAKQGEAKAKAETQRLEVEAKQSERLAITESCKDWVKFCKKAGCPIVTVNTESVATAQAIAELLKTQPNILDRVKEAKGLALQFKPADEASDIARCLVTITATKATGQKRGTTNGANRGGKLIAIFEQFATADEKAALETAVTAHKAAGGRRADGIEYKHRVQVQKRCLNADLITAE